MSKTHVHRVTVHWGDCDPAGIVFFPNFSRWMDQASMAFFVACGLPPWRELERTRQQRPRLIAASEEIEELRGPLQRPSRVHLVGMLCG